MQTIRRRLSVLFAASSIVAILLVVICVNLTINKKFNDYLINNQNKTYQRIVSYFEEVYRREGKWASDAGMELIHEAYMSNYCLTLYDKDNNVIWGMDPNNLKLSSHFKNMVVKNEGIYNVKKLQIKYENKVVGYVEIGQYASVLMSEEDVDFKSSINKSILASGTTTLILVIIIGLYFSKQFSNPIKEVANMSVSLSKGNFDTKSSTESNIEELENLRKSINILAEKLKHQDDIRKRLVSDISHEIRTPLNVLQNNLEAMIDGVFPVNEDRLNYLNEEVIRFGKLLNNLQALKEFESDSISLSFEGISMDEIIENIYNEFYMVAENKGVKLDYSIAPYKDYLVMGDRDKIKQVFINLLSNALKFTNENGRVLIKLYNDEENIIVEIKDNGIGIKKEDIPFISERLYRGDKSRSEIEGSGIGLTIVKNILHLHSAVIDVESEEGIGTTFKVYFNKYSDKDIEL